MTSNKAQFSIEETNARLFDMALDMLCVAGMDGYFKRINPAFTRVLGYSEEELMSKPFVEFVHPDDVSATLRESEKLGEGVPTIYFENRYQCKDGSYKWLAWTSSPDLKAGLLYAVARDISQQKEVEEMNDYTRKLEGQNRELERFAYITSHDLQEPLRTISNYIDLLQKHNQDNLDESSQLYLGYISESAQRMSALIKGLLYYSRIGRQRRLERVDISEKIHEVIAGLAAAIEESNATITVDPMPILEVFPEEFSLLVQNLISNAIKFRKEDTPPKLHIYAMKKFDKWEFIFEDNGIGIDPRFHDKIFVIFQRLHTRKKYEGTGIGLAHCKKIVEQHNGEIRVESTPGAGSRFIFTIPEKINIYETKN